MSGGDLQRPGWRAFIKRIVHDPELSHCFAYDRSRFARPGDPAEGTKVEKIICFAGKTIVLSTAILPPRRRSSGGKTEDLISLIEYNQAGQFRTELAKRTLRGADRNAKAGFWCGGRAPIGFKRVLVAVAEKRVVRDVEDGQVIRGAGHAIAILPDDRPGGAERIEIVRGICMAYYERTHGLRAIAKDLNMRGIPSPDHGRTRKDSLGEARPVPGRWTGGTVRNVIENPINAGFVSYGRRAFGVLARHCKDAASGFREVENEELKEQENKAFIKEVRDPEKYYLGKPAIFFEPIITEAVWRANILRLRQGAERGGLRGRPKCPQVGKYPLVVICGDCERVMTGAPSTRGRGMYRCSGHVNSSGLECHPNRVNVDELLPFVLAVISRHLQALGSKDTLQARLKDLLATGADARRADDSQLDLARATRESFKGKLKEAFRRTLAAATEVERKTMDEVCKEVGQELARAEREVVSLEEARRAQGVDSEEDLAVTVGLINRLDRFLARADGKDLRVLFNGLGVRVEVKFAQNDGRAHANRLRVPVGAVLRLGALGGPLRLPPAILQGVEVPERKTPARFARRGLLNPIS